MKAILINPEKQTVEFVEIEKGIQAIYDMIGCRTFTCPITLPNNDAFYCDDEGLYNPEIIGGIFYPEAWSHPLVGKTLIIGTDEEGESVDCKSTVEDILNSPEFGALEWVSKERAEAWAANFN